MRANIASPCQQTSIWWWTPRVADRKCADGIFYVMRTGCQWKALDRTNLCSGSTAHDRFQEWVAGDVFLRIVEERCRAVRRIERDRLGPVEHGWSDERSAPLGGEESGSNPTDRGKKGAKRSLLTEGHGIPIGLAIEGANRHDMKLVRGTIEKIVIDRPGPNETKPQGMCLDKGYDYAEVRDTLLDFGCTAHIRSRGEEARALKKEAGFRARRWVVERTHSWMNRFRRILVRWEKKAENYAAFLHFACGLIAFRASGLFG